MTSGANPDGTRSSRAPGAHGNLGDLPRAGDPGGPAGHIAGDVGKYLPRDRVHAGAEHLARDDRQAGLLEGFRTAASSALSTGPILPAGNCQDRLPSATRRRTSRTRPSWTMTAAAISGLAATPGQVTPPGTASGPAAAQ